MFVCFWGGDGFIMMAITYEILTEQNKYLSEMIHVEIYVEIGNVC